MLPNDVPDSPSSDPDSPANPQFDAYDRIYLQKLSLATEVILRLGEDNAIPVPLEAELHLLRDRIDRALLS